MQRKRELLRVNSLCRRNGKGNEVSGFEDVFRIALPVRGLLLSALEDLNLIALTGRVLLLPEEEVTKKSCRNHNTRHSCFPTCPKSRALEEVVSQNARD